MVGAATAAPAVRPALSSVLRVSLRAMETPLRENGCIRTDLVGSEGPPPRKMLPSAHAPADESRSSACLLQRRARVRGAASPQVRRAASRAAGEARRALSQAGGGSVVRLPDRDGVGALGRVESGGNA